MLVCCGGIPVSPTRYVRCLEQALGHAEVFIRCDGWCVAGKHHERGAAVAADEGIQDEAAHGARQTAPAGGGMGDYSCYESAPGRGPGSSSSMARAYVKSMRQRTASAACR